MSPKPVLAALIGADQKISNILSGAGIPNYPTEDDAVRGFMHLVRHREVMEALAQVQPAMPTSFAPDTEAARRVVSDALADGRQWLDPIEIKRLFDSRSRGGDILITFFPGAIHDFDDPDKDRRDVPANAAATAEAMRRAIEFFANSLNAQSVPK